jgi:autotransporter-associated beta strand protein
VSALRSTLRVSSINSVSGGAPTSNLGAPTTAANGTISLGTGTQFASLVYDGAGETTDRVIRLAGTSGTGITLTQEGAGLLKFTSALAFANNAASYTLRLNGSTAGAGEFAGNITNGSGGAKSLKKEGTGTWTLSGNLSYAGNTTVSGGRLVVKKLGFADASAVSVAAGAFLQLDHGATDTVGELWVAGEQKWKGTWGGVGSSAPYQTEAIEGSGLLLVTAGPEPPLTGFPAWADDSGLTGEPGFENGASDDPESDGLPNLIEWVLGGDPLGADAASRSPSVGWHDADTISFEFARSDDSESGAAVFVEYSVSLGSGVWTRVPVGATGSTASGGVSVEVEENGEAADSVRVLLPEALAPDGRFFVRLVSEVVGGP